MLERLREVVGASSGGGIFGMVLALGVDLERHRFVGLVFFHRLLGDDDAVADGIRRNHPAPFQHIAQHRIGHVREFTKFSHGLLLRK